MRIAVVVHNSVVNDARVVKEAAALAAAGHTVEIHGITKSSTSTQQSVTDLGIPVFLNRMPPLIPAPLAWGFVALVALVTLLAFFHFMPQQSAWTTLSSPVAVIVLVACILLGVGLLARLRHWV